MIIPQDPRSGPDLPACDPDALALTLDAHPDFRVLRRLQPRPSVVAPDGSVVRRGLYVDTETTGLDTVHDEIIEVAAVRFSYTSDGQVLSVDEVLEELREPARPITEEVTRLTGIAPETVAGKSIDLVRLTDLAKSADLVIAHNSAFDRPMLERLCPMFAKRPWACSLREVDWSGEGCDGNRLSHIAAWHGFFYDAHRAANDCFAGIEVLARILPQAGVPAMSRLLESARQDTFRIRADGAGFARKDDLKVRRYRWSSGMRCWHKDVGADEVEAELAWVEREVLRSPVRVTPRRITALDRYSIRAGANTWLTDAGM